MDKKLIKRILKSKGVYIFLVAAVLAAVIFKGRGGSPSDISAEELNTSSQTVTAGENIPPIIITTEEPPIVTIAPQTVTEPPQTTAAAETEPEVTTAEATTARTANPPAPAAPTWNETNIAAAVMYVNTGGVSSRARAIQGSAKAKSYDLNQKVTVVAQTDTDYYKTQDGDYIHKDYLSAQPRQTWKETELTPVRMTVNTEGVYSREVPVQGSARVNKLSKGQEITVVAQTDTDYYKAQDGSYIHKDYLDGKAPETTTPPPSEVVVSEWRETAAAAVQMYVNAEGVYSREKPIQGSTRVKQLNKDQEVTVVASTNTDYYKLQDGSFVHKDYLTDKKPESANREWNETAVNSVTMYVNTAGVYSREKPIQGSTRVNRLELNQQITVVAETNTDYYKAQDGSFIHKDYLSNGEIPEVSVSRISNNSAYGQRVQEQWEIDYCNQVFELTNQIRAEYGLSPLQKLDSLSAAAAARAWETTVYNSHTRPDGTSCFTALTEYGLTMAGRGENLAVWHDTPQKAVNSWMNNAAHRNIILNPNFKYLGVGFYYVANDPNGNYYYWEQLYYNP